MFKAALAALGLLVMPSGAIHAGGPCPGSTSSSIGSVINLGGLTGGVVDSRVAKTMTIRDCFRVPVEGAMVVVTFTNCTYQDVRLGEVQPHHPGALFNCAQRTVTAMTNGQGVATFRIAGGAASGPGSPPGAGFPGCATVHADGVAMGNLIVGAFDNNLVGGVNPADLSNWQGDRHAYTSDPANYRGRSDFDGSGSVTPADGSLLLAIRAGGGSTESCGPTCL